MADFDASIRTHLDCEFRLKEAGNGRPLLFFHGMEGPVWLPFHASLAKNNRLIMPDHPWFGESASPEWIGGIHDLAYFYLDWLDAQGLRGSNVIASCLGGWLAMEMAIRDPGIFGSIVLIGSAGLQVDGVRMGDPFLWNEPRYVENMFFDPDIRIAKEAEMGSEAGRDFWLKTKFGAARYGWSPRFSNPHLGRWLHRIKVPCQVVWGAEDRVFPPPYADALAGKLTGSSVAIIAGAGHFPHLERPEQTFAAVNGFPGCR